MRNFRAALVPLLLLAALIGLALLEFNLSVIAHFSFFWDVLLGAAVGVAMALISPLSGFQIRRNATTSMYWICAFVTLLLIFYQYMTFVTGLKIDALSFLAMPRGRARVVEGVFLGYCSLVAGRGKV